MKDSHNFLMFFLSNSSVLALKEPNDCWPYLIGLINFTWFPILAYWTLVKFVPPMFRDFVRQTQSLIHSMTKKISKLKRLCARVGTRFWFCPEPFFAEIVHVANNFPHHLRTMQYSLVVLDVEYGWEEVLGHQGFNLVLFLGKLHYSRVHVGNYHVAVGAGPLIV